MLLYDYHDFSFATLFQGTDLDKKLFIKIITAIRLVD